MAKKQTRVQLWHNPKERDLLDLLAKFKGFKDANTWLSREISGLPNKMTTVNCEAKEGKNRITAGISDELLPFYKKLSCFHGLDIGEVIKAYIVFPAFKEFLENHPMPTQV